MGLYLSGNAQQSFKDNLLMKLKQAKEDTNKVKLLIDLAKTIEDNEPETAAAYSKTAEALSSKLSYKEGLFAATTRLGASFYIKGLFNEALIAYERSLKMAHETKNRINTGTAHLNLSSAYREMGNFEKALMHSLEGRKAISNTSNNLLKAQMDDALQVLYFTRGEYNKGIVYGERALLFVRKSKDKVQLAKYLINLSLNYNSTKRLKEAELMLNESLAISKVTKDKRVEATALLNLSDLAIKEGNALKIRKYCMQSLKLQREIGSFDGEAVALKAIAMSFLIEKRTDSANYYATKAYRIDTAKGFRRETIEVLDLFSHISFASGKINEGFTYNRRFGDSLFVFVSDIISQQSAELEKKYETEKKQGQIARLQSQTLLQQLSISRKNMLNYILAASAVALLLIFIISYRSYKNKQKLQQQKINTLETEKQLTATEAILKGEEQERSRLAKDLHDGLGGMLSGIKFSFNTMKGNLIMTPENAQSFERSMDMLDSSIKEMRRVAHNMMPEALVKFGLDTALKDFCNDISKSGALQVTYQSIDFDNQKIEQTTAITIYRIIQELINNVIKHAAAKTAIVQLSKSDNRLTVTIEDDGKGFNIALLKGTNGMGWANIQNRIDFLKGKLDINSETGKGTSVFIEITLT